MRCMTLMAALALTTFATAGDPIPPDEGSEVEALRQEVASLRQRLDAMSATSDDWLTEARAEEIRGLVQDVLADADQADWLTGRAEPDGDLWADRDKLEISCERTGGVCVPFVAAVEPDLRPEEAAADTDANSTGRVLSLVLDVIHVRRQTKLDRWQSDLRDSLAHQV